MDSTQDNDCFNLLANFPIHNNKINPADAIFGFLFLVAFISCEIDLYFKQSFLAISMNSIFIIKSLGKVPYDKERFTPNMN